MNPQVVVGSVVGTGAAINVEIGFVPNKVSLVNQTSGRTMVWYSTMAAGAGIVSGAVVANGVSAYDGKPTAGYGFTIGTDAVNTNTNVIAYEATRSGPGAK